MYKNVNQIICDAIELRKVIQFDYILGYRTAEPYCYGISRKGNELLRAFHTSCSCYSEFGDPVHWKLFTVEKMSDITITDEEFHGGRPD